jgi:hypothetical protein
VVWTSIILLNFFVLVLILIWQLSETNTTDHDSESESDIRFECPCGESSLPTGEKMLQNLGDAVRIKKTLADDLDIPLDTYFPLASL